ncbi:hypothetical protein [Euzebya sp.]|uniref:hypothetical protein n=1 Tax=Euzebya sp. TaxID=1971409 RepID=UPI003516E420
MTATPPGYDPSAGFPSPAPPAPGRPPGSTAIRVGVVLMVLAVVGGVALVVVSLTSLVGQQAPQEVDGSAVVDGEEGDQFVLYRVDGAETPVDCRVTGPDEQPVGLSPPFGSSTLTLSDTTYSAVRTFELVADGRHTVSCSDAAGRLAVGPEFPLFRSLGLVFLGVFGGGGTFVVGLVVLIIGIVRRSSARRTPPAWQGGPPAGPYGGSWPT